MSELFKDSDCNGDISEWDVSNVTTMEGMFAESTTFSQPLNDWGMFQVTDMRDMFRGAKLFNEPLENWDVSTVAFLITISWIGTFWNSFFNLYLSNFIHCFKPIDNFAKYSLPVRFTEIGIRIKMLKRSKSYKKLTCSTV